MKASFFLLIKKSIKHELIKGSFFIFIGTLFGNIFAFLFNLLLARNLSYVDYGEYAAINSLLALLFIASNSFGNIIVKFSTEFYTKKETNKLKAFFVQSTKAVGFGGICILLALLLFQGFLRDFLHLSNPVYLFMLGVIVIISYLGTVNISILQSMIKFNFVAITVIVNAVLKFLFGVLLIFFGMRVFGAFTAIILASFAAYLLSFFPILPILSQKGEKAVISLPNVFAYAVPAFITLLALSLYISTDVILVKHFFSGKEAGIYSGLSLVGKVIFYFTGVIPNVMFPLLIKRRNKGENIVNLFSLSLLLVLIPGLLITCFYFVFPNFAIQVILGGKGYLAASKYVGLFGLFITVFSMINIFANFFLSVGKTKIAIILLLGAFSQAGLIWFFHKNFEEVIYSSIFSSLVVLVLLLLYYVKTYVSFDFFKNAFPFFDHPSL